MFQWSTYPDLSTQTILLCYSITWFWIWTIVSTKIVQHKYQPLWSMFLYLIYSSWIKVLLSTHVLFQRCSASHFFQILYVHTWELPGTTAVYLTSTGWLAAAYLPRSRPHLSVAVDRRQATLKIRGSLVMRSFSTQRGEQHQPGCICWMSCLSETCTLLLALFIFYLLELIGLSLWLYFEPVKALPSFSTSAKNGKEGKWPCIVDVSQDSFASAN